MRVELLGTPVDALSFEETVARAREPMTQRGIIIQVSLNVAKLVNILGDTVLREDVNSSDVISAEGMGILLAGRLPGIPIPTRVAGMELMSGVLALFAREGFRPHFLAATADVLKKPWPRRLSAIGTTLGGKPRRLLPPGRGNRRGGQDKKVAGRLSVCRHADTSE